MIVYSHDNYSFLNYKDQVKSLTPLFKLTKVRKEHKEMPSLSNNFVLVFEDGNIQTAGSPQPGGYIYLQKGYCAIDYDSTKSGFELIVSNAYVFNENYLQILPTHHCCTPLLRLFNRSPKEFMFVKGGCLYTTDDLVLDGLQSDYVAIEGGSILAMFDVQPVMYPAVTYPTDLLQALTCGSYIATKGETALFQPVGKTEGLVPSNITRKVVQDQRQLIRNYEYLNIDYSKVPEFGKPVSDSLMTNGVVVSALNKIVGQQYLNDMEEQKKKLSELLEAIVFKEAGLHDLMMMDNIPDDLLSLARNEHLTQSCVFFLNSDFQAILDLYNFTYNFYKGKISLGALKNMQGSLTASIASLNEKAFDAMSEGLTSFLGVPFSRTFSFAIQSSDFSSFRVALEGWDHSDKEQVAERATALTEVAKKVIENTGHDTPLDAGKIIEFKKNFPVDTITEENAESCLDSLDLIGDISKKDDITKTMLYGRLITPLVNEFSKIRAVKEAISQPFVTEVRRGADSGRPCWLLKKKGWTTNCALSEMVGRVQHIVINESSVDLKVRFEWAQIDTHSDCDKWGGPGSFANIMKQHAHSRINTSGVTGTFHVTGTGRTGGTRRATTAMAHQTGKVMRSLPAGHPMGYFVEGVFTFNMATNISEMYLSSFSEFKDAQSGSLSWVFVDLFKTAGANEIAAAETRATEVAALFPELVSYLAASAAYGQCRYLFNTCKENYEFEAYGVQGLDYRGVPVLIPELSQVAKVDVLYVETLKKLIDGIPDEAMKNALSGFYGQLGELVLSIRNPIYYVSKHRLTEGGQRSSLTAALHYIYGGV